MSLPINPISSTQALISVPTAVTSSSPSTGFQSVLSQAIQHVEASGSQADSAAQTFLSGGTQELHNTVLAAQSAELDFETFMQVRNKVVSAYEEIMRMQV